MLTSVFIDLPSCCCTGQLHKCPQSLHASVTTCSDHYVNFCGLYSSIHYSRSAETRRPQRFSQNAFSDIREPAHSEMSIPDRRLISLPDPKFELPKRFRSFLCKTLQGNVGRQPMPDRFIWSPQSQHILIKCLISSFPTMP